VPLQVALVDYQLKYMLDQGALRLGSSAVHLHEYVQPASIDLPISGAVYLVKEKVLPFRKQVRQLLEELVLEDKDLKSSCNGAVLLKGQTYLVYCGKVRLPEGCRGCLSPKSSIGRVDVMVRGVVDGCGLYDIIPGDGKERELWLEISPRSFNVRVHQGTAMTQLMLFMSPDDVNASELPVIDAAELAAHHAAIGRLRRRQAAGPRQPWRRAGATAAAAQASRMRLKHGTRQRQLRRQHQLLWGGRGGGASDEEAEEDEEERGASWQRKLESRMYGSLQKSARTPCCM
jgi:hypothetical protein